MAKPVLAIDIDEVLFPHVEELTRFFNERHDARVKLEDYVTYEFKKAWKRDTEEEVEEVVQAFLSLDHREKVMPLSNAKAALGRLRERYSLVVITSRDAEFEQQTREWLDHNFAGYFDDVVMVGNPWTGRQFRSKVELCRELGAAALVDDALEYALECARAGIRVLLFGNYPWNQADKLPEGVTRVRNWAEVEKTLA